MMFDTMKRRRPTDVFTQAQWDCFDREARKAAAPYWPATMYLRDQSSFTLTEGDETTQPPAAIDMETITEGVGGEPVYQLTSLPLPTTFGRVWLAGSYLKAANKIDYTLVRTAAVRVAKAVEKVVFSDPTAKTPVMGILNHPSVEKVRAADLVGAVIEAKKFLYTWEQRFYGPYALFLPAKDERDSGIDKQHLANAVSGVDAIRSPATPTAVLVQTTLDVIRMIVGLDLCVCMAEEQTQPDVRVDLDVMCCIVPQVRADSRNHIGIVTLEVE